MLSLQIEFTCLSNKFQSDLINILGLKLNDLKYKFINIHQLCDLTSYFWRNATTKMPNYRV